MEDDILQVIEEEMAGNPSLEEIKTVLLAKGYQDKDVDEALGKFKGRFKEPKDAKTRKNIALFGTKEVLDRIGYGFATNQFVSILFYQTAIAAGLSQFALLIVGLFNGLKSILSAIISSFLQEYRKVRRLSKRFIGVSGIVFGFSFLFMAMARSWVSPELFAFALLIGSIGVVSYGDLYNELLKETLKKERMGAFLARVSQYGILITAAAIVLSGFIMDAIPPGHGLVIMGKTLPLYGYLISFEITAFAFILSGYIISGIKEKNLPEESALAQGPWSFIKQYHHKVLVSLKVFAKNKVLLLLLFSSVLLGVAQALVNSYAGIFIYEEFKGVALGGFLNVAVIFAIAVIVSLFGPWITTSVQRSIGYSPMLVFGTLLVAMFPFMVAWNPNIYAIGAANALSIIGAAIVGVAQGLLARKLLKEEERKLYFASLSLIILAPFLILLPVGAWAAQAFGLSFIFKAIFWVLIALVVPLYIILVGIAEKRRNHGDDTI